VKKRKVSITLEQADAHQRKHGFPPLLQQAVDETLVKLKVKKPRKLNIGGRKMNQTEREFEALLKCSLAVGTIQAYRFEGIVLPWGDGMRYKADFAVKQKQDKPIKLIEVKGAHIWKHAIVRYKGCRAEWKDWFEFEFWTKDENNQWHQLA
jgi:hypothetical protein